MIIESIEKSDLVDFNLSQDFNRMDKVEHFLTS